MFIYLLFLCTAVRSWGYFLIWAIQLGMCGPKWQGFSAVLVIKRVLTLAILVKNRVWFQHSSPELGMFLRRSYLFIFNCQQKPFITYVWGNCVSRNGHKIGYRIFGRVIYRVAKNADFGHKQGWGFGKWAAHPTQLFWKNSAPPSRLQILQET